MKVVKNNSLMKATDSVYHKLFLGSGLKIGSLALNNYVSLGFAILDACETTIRKSNVSARQMGEHLPRKVLFNDECKFTCSNHESSICAKATRVRINVFFNNQGKYSIGTVVTDLVVSFKNSDTLNLVLHSLFWSSGTPYLAL